jgi:hypothetical protein
MSTPDPAIVAHPTDNTKPDPPHAVGTAQSFTIRCMECGDDLGSHLSDCPGVIAAGYDTAGNGAFSARVYPQPGTSFYKHASALSALRLFSMIGPVALHLEDGRVIDFLELD